MKMNQPNSAFRVLMAGLVLSVNCLSVNATTVNVSVDTSALYGSASFMVFDFLDGDATPDNNVTISNFNFGGGVASLSPPVYSCTSDSTGVACAGIYGDLNSAVTMNDQFDFYNEFVGQFSMGSVLSFTLDYSANFAGGTPDSFLFSLLDGNGNVIPTSDPLGTDTLLNVDLSSLGIIDVSGGTGPNTVASPVVTAVPEPGIWVLMFWGMLGVSRYCREIV
ncbi:MAG: NF038129 family PEP-CTERM protein [Methylococcales bacterium]